MPLLAFDPAPPPAKTFGTAYNGQEHPAKAKGTPMVVEKVIKETISPEPVQPAIEEGPKNAYPVVKLDVDTISEAVAGRLATSLLGHVLFLKNQVPFPVMQLGRLPGGKPNSRAFKQRAELLTSYDIISSHLDTTFSAISTALAQCVNNSGSASDKSKKLAQAHVAILVGPSLGTAKAKVIMGIDGLETRVWGVREETVKTEENDNVEDEQREDEDGSEGDSDEDEEDNEDEEDEEDALEGSDDGAEEPEESEDEGESELGEEEEDNEEPTNEALEKLSPPPRPSYISYAEEQRFLQNADRLLSRTLAAADAEGNGITSEMTPTQTHILIRAPRRFNHPAWIPRQNVTTAMDASLQDFMNNSGFANADVPAPSKKNSRKGKVEGVWVTSRAGIQDRAEAGIVNAEARKDGDADEMIWWSWDGKFVGFNDW